MTRRRRVTVGILLSVALVALALATYHNQGVVSVAMGAVCVLALAWAYILASDRGRS